MLRRRWLGCSPDLFLQTLKFSQNPHFVGLSLDIERMFGYNIARTCVLFCGEGEKSTPSPIVVRYGNGHSEVWNAEPPRLSFLRAACVAKIAPISDPRQCAACALRTVSEPVLEEIPLPRVVRPTHRKVARGGKVIPFPQRVAAAAS